jgi:hypothetical protein
MAGIVSDLKSLKETKARRSHDVGSRNSTEMFSVPDPNYCVHILKQFRVLYIFFLFFLSFEKDKQI